jgi:phosphotransferase system  glucose/maltose/N-acetylglucosamine-specific IIC component
MWMSGVCKKQSIYLLIEFLIARFFWHEFPFYLKFFPAKMDLSFVDQGSVLYIAFFDVDRLRWSA